MAFIPYAPFRSVITATAARPHTRSSPASTTTTTTSKSNDHACSRRAFNAALAASTTSLLAAMLSPPAAHAALMNADEASDVLSAVTAAMDAWIALSKSADIDDFEELRRDLRAGSASRLRQASAAVPKLCKSAQIAGATAAKNDAIRAIEGADAAALRVYRKQEEDSGKVTQQLGLLNEAVGQLLAILNDQ